MYITKIDPKKPSKVALKKAVTTLKSGGLVVFPTETAYGLACDAQNASAVRKIFEVKTREAGKPLPLIAGTKAMARKVGFMNAMTKNLSDAFWPGPLTVVIPAVPGLPKGIPNKEGEVAVRVSSDPVASALAKWLGHPIVATSANRSGKGPHYDIPSVIEDLGDMPDVVLDAGKLALRAPSTVVRCGEDECEVLREGPVTLEGLIKALRRCR